MKLRSTNSGIATVRGCAGGPTAGEGAGAGTLGAAAGAPARLESFEDAAAALCGAGLRATSTSVVTAERTTISRSNVTTRSPLNRARYVPAGMLANLTVPRG